MRGEANLWEPPTEKRGERSPSAPLNDNWMPTVTAGGLGWVVYSPPMEATVSKFGVVPTKVPGSGTSDSRYTPDTEAWLLR